MNINVKDTEQLTSNMEDYLEAIAVLKEKEGVVRVKDISSLLGVRTSSVSSALGGLVKKGLVVHARYGYARLTPEGRKIAGKVKEKHDLLQKFLAGVLKINDQIAAEDACKMEHVISPQTFQKLTKFIEFVETCPDHDRPDWLKSFDNYFKTGKRLRCKARQVKQKTKGKS